MQDIESYYAKLRDEVTEKVNRTMESPTDFNYLSAQVKIETDEDLSSSTLKRFFGYIPKNGTPSRTTLCILSRYLGYKGWNDFCQDMSESDFIADDCIITSDLTKDDIVHFEWAPDRVYEAKYLGNGRYEVTVAQNGTLGVGDKFSASGFTLNHPLYMNKIERVSNGGSSAQSNYVAGYKSGLTNIELVKEKSNSRTEDQS